MYNSVLDRFFKFVLTEPIAQSVARDLINAPISDTVQRMIEEQVFNKMECKGTRVQELVNVAIAIETGAYDAWKFPVAVCLAILFIILLVTIISVGYVQFSRNLRVVQGSYFVEAHDEHDLHKSQTSIGASSLGTSQASQSRLTGRFGADNVVVRFMHPQGERCLAKTLCSHFQAETLIWRTKKLLVKMTDDLVHVNVVRAMGVAKRESGLRLITYMPRKGRFQVRTGFRMSYMYWIDGYLETAGLPNLPGISEDPSTIRITFDMALIIVSVRVFSTLNNYLTNFVFKSY